MERDINNINAKLRECQAEWFNNICKPWLAKGGERPEDMKNWTKSCFGEIAEYSFSQPFFTGVNDIKKPLIMIVGQETNGWGDISEFSIDVGEAKWNINNSQERTIYYLKKNIELSVSTSTFWKFIIELKKEHRFSLCWNNLDKIHYIIHNATKRKRDTNCIKLYSNDEKTLNNKIGSNKTLMQQEIDIIKPDLIIFLTGPNYKDSMETALQIKLAKIPDKNNEPIVAIDKNKIWTYHPSFLYREAELKKKVLSKLNCAIGKIV